VFASFHSVTDTVITGGTGPVGIVLDNVSLGNGFASFGAPTDVIPIPADGAYDFTFSLQVEPTGNDDYFFWLESSPDAISWTPIAYTNSCVSMKSNEFDVFTVQFTIPLGTSIGADYLRVVGSSATTFTVKTLTSLTVPAVPAGSPDTPGYVGYIRLIPK